MSISEKVTALHPDPEKQPTQIDRDKYEAMRAAILKAIEEHGELAFKALAQEAEARLEGVFEGSIGWYVTTVKLDLEARDLLERIPGKSPQVLRLKR